MRRIDLTDPNPPRDQVKFPPKVSLLVSQRVGDNHWGELEPLRGTSWEAGVEVIADDVFTKALYGHLMPLIRALGRDPLASGKRVTPEEGWCGARVGCDLWDPKFCRPGGQQKKEKGPLGCYEPPVAGGNPEHVALLQEVAQAWREGRHTIVVGEGFNLLKFARSELAKGR